MTTVPGSRKIATLQACSPAPVPPPLLPGDPVPWFVARSDANPDFRFSSLGGRYIVLSFPGSFSRPECAPLFGSLMAGAARFADFATGLVLVTHDPADERACVPPGVMGVRYFFDFDGAIATLLGVAAARGGHAQGPVTFIIDERLRILAVITLREAAAHAAQVYAIFDRLPPLPSPAMAVPQAPVIIVPRVFERSFCKTLLDGYQAHGGVDSGFMVERSGMTVATIDHDFKRRCDWNMSEAALIKGCHARIQRRLLPEIQRAFQFNATRIERNIVACYVADQQGHFSAHRDNTTQGTAHRRFAVSINLNAEEYEGGDLVFPEFGRARYRPPTGGACVFSCSLLHEATAVTRGTRYVYVPFLYDDAAADLRSKNEKFLQL